MSKKYKFDIETKTGTFIKTLIFSVPTNRSEKDELVMSPIQIVSEMNGGQGSMTIDIDTYADDFDTNAFAHMNVVKLYLVDEVKKYGRLLFTGVITSLRPYFAQTKQGLKIEAISFVANLSNIFYQNGGGLAFTESSIDPGDLIEDIIYYFRTIYTNSSINYLSSSPTGDTTNGSKTVTNLSTITNVKKGMTISGTGIPSNTMVVSVDTEENTLTMDKEATADGSTMSLSLDSIENTGVNITIDFNKTRCRQAIDTVRNLAGGNYFWRLDPDGTLLYRSKPDTPTHIFDLHNHIDYFELDDSVEPVRNKLYLTWDNGGNEQTDSFSNSSSISSYETREAEITETDITDTTTRDERGNGFIAENKDPKKRVRQLIINDEYDIESIHPGDTCTIEGFKDGKSPVGENMQIVKVSYDTNRASLVLEEDFLNFAKQVKNSITA